jgi:hypothetical protein
LQEWASPCGWVRDRPHNSKTTYDGESSLHMSLIALPGRYLFLLLCTYDVLSLDLDRMYIITNLHQRLCGEGSIMTLWTMTDIAGTYRAASHLIPFDTSRGFAYPAVTSHIFLEGGGRHIARHSGANCTSPIPLSCSRRSSPTDSNCKKTFFNVSGDSVLCLTA